MTRPLRPIPYHQRTHHPCPRCRRLLPPNKDGQLPLHRKPPRKGTYNCKTQPLTGRDAPWCLPA